MIKQCHKCKGASFVTCVVDWPLLKSKTCPSCNGSGVEWEGNKVKLILADAVEKYRNDIMRSLHTGARVEDIANIVDKVPEPYAEIASYVAPYNRDTFVKILKVVPAPIRKGEKVQYVNNGVTYRTFAHRDYSEGTFPSTTGGQYSIVNFNSVKVERNGEWVSLK